MGKSFWECVHADDLSRIQAEVDSTRSNGHISHLKFQWLVREDLAIPCEVVMCFGCDGITCILRRYK